MDTCERFGSEEGSWSIGAILRFTSNSVAKFARKQTPKTQRARANGPTANRKYLLMKKSTNHRHGTPRLPLGRSGDRTPDYQASALYSGMHHISTLIPEVLWDALAADSPVWDMLDAEPKERINRLAA